MPTLVLDGPTVALLRSKLGIDTLAEKLEGLTVPVPALVPIPRKVDEREKEQRELLADAYLAVGNFGELTKQERGRIIRIQNRFCRGETEGKSVEEQINLARKQIKSVSDKFEFLYVGWVDPTEQTDDDPTKDPENDPEPKPTKNNPPIDPFETLGLSPAEHGALVAAGINCFGDLPTNGNRARVLEQLSAVLPTEEAELVLGLVEEAAAEAEKAMIAAAKAAVEKANQH